MKKNHFKVILYSSLGVVSLSIFNKIVFSLSTIKNKLDTQNKNFYEWRYGKVFYTVKGSGSPVLLIHEVGVGSSGYTWNETMDKLSETHTVYNIDLIGFGRSDKPIMTYTAYLYVQLINDFIHNVIKEETSVISTSTSCPFTIMACHQDSTLFDKLLLIDPPSVAKSKKYPNSISKIKRRFFGSPLLGTIMYNFVSSKFYIKNLLSNKCYYNKNKISKKIVHIFNESAHLNGIGSKYAFVSYISKYMNADITTAIESIDNSICIFSTKTKAVNNEYLRHNPSIECIEFNKSYCYPQIEEFQKFYDACDMFLDTPN